MNRQFLISGVVITLIVFALGFLIHGVLLNSEYARLPSLFRTQEEQAGYFHWMILANFSIGFAVTWIYRQGVDHSSPVLVQGIRFGVALAFLMTIPWFLVYYAVQPLPGVMVLKQIVFESIGDLVIGVAAAYLNRTPVPPAA